MYNRNGSRDEMMIVTSEKEAKSVNKEMISYKIESGQMQDKRVMFNDFNAKRRRLIEEGYFRSSYQGKNEGRQEDRRR